MHSIDTSNTIDPQDNLNIFLAFISVATKSDHQLFAIMRNIIDIIPDDYYKITESLHNQFFTKDLHIKLEQTNLLFYIMGNVNLEMRVAKLLQQSNIHDFLTDQIIKDTKLNSIKDSLQAVVSLIMPNLKMLDKDFNIKAGESYKVYVKQIAELDCTPLTKDNSAIQLRDKIEKLPSDPKILAYYNQNKSFDTQQLNQELEKPCNKITANTDSAESKNSKPKTFFQKLFESKSKNSQGGKKSTMG